MRVTPEMLQRALDAYWDGENPGDYYEVHEVSAMRAALEAALDDDGNDDD